MANRFRWRFQEKFKLLLLDAIVYVVIATLLFFALTANPQAANLLSSPGFYFIAFNVLVWNYVFGNYEIENEKSFLRTFRKSLFVFLSVLLVVTFANYMAGKERSGVFGRGVLAGSLVGFWLYLQLSRQFLSRLWQRAHENYKWIFISDEETKQNISKDLNRVRLPLAIEWNSQTSEAHLLSQADSLLGVVYSSKKKDSALIEALMNVRMQGLVVFDLIDFYEMYFKKIPIFYLSSDFFSFSKGFSILGDPSLQRLKRLSDILIAFSILLPALPIMLITGILVRLESSGPALYSQVRTGKGGKPFLLYKFRSMRSDAEKQGAQWAQVNDSRVTNLGKILRKTRLDELPQLWNILKGEMSFIGPRPERPEFNQKLEKEIPFYQLRHSVRPGLTGWAQVNYPYGASIEDSFQKLQYDLFYVKNFSLILDFQIMLKTVRVVVLGQGR